MYTLKLAHTHTQLRILFLFLICRLPELTVCVWVPLISVLRALWCALHLKHWGMTDEQENTF